MRSAPPQPRPDSAFEADFTATNQDGTPATQAGSHPTKATTSFALNTTESSPDGELKDIDIQQVAGLSGDPGAVPKCRTTDFLASFGGTAQPSCPNESAVGLTAVQLELPGIYFPATVYNLQTTEGVTGRLGFTILDLPVTMDLGVKQGPDYNVVASVKDAPRRSITFLGSVLKLWGDPADSAHDSLRGHCLKIESSVGEPKFIPLENARRVSPRSPS